MPSAILLDLYGSSEVAADSTCYRVGESESLTCSPIGRPIANTQVYILDQYGQPAPIGVPGELHVGGDSLSRGYLNQPELTAAKFIRNPFSEVANARLYKTGDLGRYLPDGNIEYLGRSDFQIKLRGFRIELAEIEAVLAQHPGVGQNVVLAREDVPGDKRLVAYFVPRNGQEPTVAELRHFLQQKLPGYMVPSAFVLLEKFPLTASAKVNRPALPAPNLQHYEHLESVAPRDAFEATLVKIFENVLGVSPVGIKDDFFQLGGHSVLAVRLVAEISKVIGKNLPLAALFQAADVQSLASIAREGPEAWAYPLVMEIRSNSESAETTKPPFFCATAPGTLWDTSRWPAIFVEIESSTSCKLIAQAARPVLLIAPILRRSGRRWPSNI
jgi:acyl carrier protein